MEQINIREYFETEKEKLRTACSITPHLAIIDPTPQDKGNQLYVRNKIKDFEAMRWETTHMIVNNQSEYLEALEKAQLETNCIIVQRPAKEGICLDDNDVPAIMDADGLNSNALVLPATVRGIVDYLDACGFEFEGKNAVVLGRSKIVGKPMADELLRRNMTVTVCHSRTPRENMVRCCSSANLIICATGKPAVLHRYETNLDAIVVDVGINYVNGKLVGDFVETTFPDIDGWSTPVPGGVGLLTRLGLMKNCVDLTWL